MAAGFWDCIESFMLDYFGFLDSFEVAGYSLFEILGASLVLGLLANFLVSYRREG